MVYKYRKTVLWTSNRTETTNSTMKLLIVFVSLLAVALCKPIEQTVAVTQDTAGNYKVVVNLEDQTRAEQRNADGTVSGSYSYVDATGALRTIQYTAGPDGFRATGDLPMGPVDNNLPIGDTEEVAKARAEHLALFQQGVPKIE